MKKLILLLLILPLFFACTDDTSSSSEPEPEPKPIEEPKGCPQGCPDGYECFEDNCGCGSAGNLCGPGLVCRNGLCTVPACGDGIPEGAEECDDGNLKNRDGCSSTCKIERPECNSAADCADSNAYCVEGRCVSNE